MPDRIAPDPAAAPAAGAPRLEARQLQLRAGTRLLIDRLDWQAAAGQCWCILGRNGAGKSSLLRALAGLAAPAAGEIRIDGRPIATTSPAALARLRAYLPQSRSDSFGYRVLDSVLAARHPYQAGRYWDSGDDAREAIAALALLDAAHLAERDLRQLSGGERQRVAIATVLAQQTAVVLLDEPATALDLAHQAVLMRLLGQLRARRHTVILVGHDLNLAQEAATHALLLLPEGGWIAGAADTVLTPAHLEACLGHPIQRLEHDGRTVFLPARSLP